MTFLIKTCEIKDPFHNITYKTICCNIRKKDKKLIIPQIYFEEELCFRTVT